MTNATAMLPTTSRLLAGVQSALGSIVASEQLSKASLARLASIDFVLNEIRLRQDCSFYRDFYAKAHALATRGMVLAKRSEAAPLPPPFGPEAAHDVISEAIEAAFAVLADLVKANHGQESAAAADFLRAVVAIELEYYSHRTLTAPSGKPPALPRESTISRERFAAYLLSKFPERQPELGSFIELVGGFQKKTFMFDIAFADGTAQSLVLRAEKPDRFVQLDASAVTAEYEVVQILHDGGVPSARPMWIEPDESQLGCRFMVSEKMIGETLGSSLVSRDFSDETARSMAETLAQVHRLPIDPFARSCLAPWMQWNKAQENTGALMDFWRRQPWFGAVNASPARARLVDWLETNIPLENAPVCLLHTDYGPHNFLIHDERISAVLDWENARIGDPAEDLSYLLQCLGDRADRANIVKWYEDAAGWKISPTRLQYFDVYNNIKLLLGSAFASALYEHDPEADIEWCNIGLFTARYGLARLQNDIDVADAHLARLA
ncbi:Predicted kinase, aminoglycoside phosphotransferase (APT) family [Sphingobium faniae]|nr:Predicted kinase, aminoglycoside phosphotransferase (APT) family [Sphingobium faniae]